MRNEQHTIDNITYTFFRISHKRDFYLFRCQASDGKLPAANIRHKLETWLGKRNREHITIYTDATQVDQVWVWVLREPGLPIRRFSHKYSQGQSGESLIQKLEQIEIALEEEDDVTLVDVTSRVRAAFNVERATKKFYDQFKSERSAFEKFVLGIPDVDMSKWYVSVMLNRLMFVYFIQRKGFLDGDTDYLHNRMRMMQKQHGGDQFYSFYRYFLLRLFHEGLGEPDHNDELERLIGNVPYLNGGIFQLHEVEQKYPDIQISDKAFTRIFKFFDQYQWHLDDRPLRDDKEINPDVLGYIFEKYINQKQMGAYYTKEDITEYISKNTILPFLFDEAKKDCAIAFEGENSIWQFPQADPNRYIYAAVQKGTSLPLPDEIAIGLDDVSQRQQWNRRTPDEYALPTEIWRETVARRQRYEEVHGKLAAGEVNNINDFITYNLDIQQLAQDVIENSEGPELLRAFWKALNRVSVLDPTCGSGAFLFAALNILQPLYEACLERMEAFVEELDADAHPQKYSDFKQVLAQVAQHPNQTYYVLKSIVVNNLYGVDIMAEAVEIAKLRLFLKLVAQVDRDKKHHNLGLEPLPDIDFNIRAGNTLVGFTSKEEVAKAMQTTQAGQRRLIFAEDQTALTAIEEKAGDVDRLFSRFREMQTRGDLHDFDAADFVETKKQLQARLRDLESELNRYLALQCGINPDNKQAYIKWLATHQPFHWFIEFYGILKQGGFDVIIGNPPYLEMKQVKYALQNLLTDQTRTIHAACIERSLNIMDSQGCISMIVPLAIVSTQRMEVVQSLLESNNRDVWYANYSWRPAKLFDTVNRALTIFTSKRGFQGKTYTTEYQKWTANNRDYLLSSLNYALAFRNRQAFWIPKISLNIESDLLKRMLSIESLLGHYLVNSSHKVYYRSDGGLYWKVFTDFAPAFKVNGILGSSTRERTISFSSNSMVLSCIAALSSDIFWWWYTVTSNCRHLNPYDLFHFPIPKTVFEKNTALISLAQDYLDDIQTKSTMLVRNQKQTGKTETQSFKIQKSKLIIEKLNVSLGMHYGFNHEDLDFISNYDIKYRMGEALFGSDKY